MERTEEQRQDVHSREGPSSPGNADIMRKKKTRACAQKGQDEPYGVQPALPWGAVLEGIWVENGISLCVHN